MSDKITKLLDEVIKFAQGVTKAGGWLEDAVVAKKELLEARSKLLQWNADEVTRLTSLLARMGEVGDELLPEFEICGTLDNPKNKCPICRETWGIGADEIHTPDCPVTKWAELRKEMEG